MRKILILFLFTGFLWSCSSDDDNGGATSTLPVKIDFTEDGETFNVLFSYNGNKISKMKYSLGSPGGNTEAVFEYEGDKITKMTLDLVVGVITNTYTYENNRIATMTTDYGRDGSTLYTYNWLEDNKVRKSGGDCDCYTDFYITNGNVVKTVESFAESLTEINYTFDNKNGIFKNVEGFQYLIEEDNLFFNRNNVTKEVTTAGDNTSTTNYSYEYNNKDYPTKQTENADNNLIITYNQ